jgi:UDP-glucose 4-epimerase
VLGTFRILDAARRADVERVVQASTGGALIGDATPPVSEQSLPSQSHPTGQASWPGRLRRTHLPIHAGPRTVAIRFGNVYGPWCVRKRGVLNVFFESIHSGVPLIIYGDGPASRDHVHVDDISSVLRLALEKDVPGGTVLHAASGVETTVRDLADLCRQAAGVPDYPIEYRPKRAGEVGALSPAGPRRRRRASRPAGPAVPAEATAISVQRELQERAILLALQRETAKVYSEGRKAGTSPSPVLLIV